MLQDLILQGKYYGI